MNKICEGCGKSYYAVSYNQRFCGIGCKLKHRSVSPMRTFKCEVCSKEFGSRTKVKYCSDQCQKVGFDKLHKHRLPDLVDFSTSITRLQDQVIAQEARIRELLRENELLTNQLNKSHGKI